MGDRGKTCKIVVSKPLSQRKKLQWVSVYFAYRLESFKTVISMSLSWRKDSSGLVFLWGGYMYTVHVSTFEIVVGISELEKRLQWISFCL